MKSDTLFMNISSDEVTISDWEMNIFLHRNDVEKVLWPKLVQLVREWNYKNIIVLNWPWGFTNLRVGTLCMNILNAIMKNQLNFYDTSKIDLYTHAYEKWFLPKYWVIYIWQKRNIRLRDFEKNERIWQYSFDEIKENIDSPSFLDEVVEDNYYPDSLNGYSKTSVSFDWSNLTIDYLDKIISFSIDELGLKPLKSVVPNYMMEPSITMQK